MATESISYIIQDKKSFRERITAILKAQTLVVDARRAAAEFVRKNNS